MQLAFLSLALILSVAALSQAFTFTGRMSPSRAIKRQQQKSCCLPSQFTAVAVTQGEDTTVEADNKLDKSEYLKTQTIIKGQGGLYKSEEKEYEDPVKSLMKPKGSNTIAHFAYFGDSDCWYESDFQVDESDPTIQGAFCMDVGAYTGKENRNGVTYDTWLSQSQQDNTRISKKTYAVFNSKGECLPALDERTIDAPGNHEGSSVTTFTVRQSTKAEIALLNTPAEMCDF